MLASAVLLFNPTWLQARSVDLIVTASDVPDPARAGNYLTNIITVTNLSSQIAAAVVVTETLDPTLSFVSASGGGTYTNGTVQWPVGTLNPGTGARLTAVFLPMFAGSASNRVVVTTSDIDTNSANDTASATTTIADYPTIAVSDVNLVEGDSTTNAYFTVTLSARSDSTLSARFRTVTVNAQSPPPATPDVDYHATNGIVSFAPGITNVTVSIPVFGDNNYEYDEKFLLYLERNSGAAIIDDTGWCTIVDDDLPQILVTNPKVLEGNSGSTTVNVQVTLSNPIDRPLEGDFSTANGTATGSSDFQSTGNYIFFDVGMTNLIVPVTVFGDTVRESNEVFYVNVSFWSVGGAQSTCTIVDDDIYFPARNPARTNGGFQIQLNGAPGNTYVLQSTTNFVQWTPIATNTIPANGSVTFVDNGALGRRFYRGQLVWPPPGSP